MYRLSDIKDLVLQELLADGWTDDETTRLVVSGGERCLAKIIAKADGIFSGRGVLENLSEIGNLKLLECVSDGARFTSGNCLAEFEGDAQTVLGVERTLLNFLMHLSGVATLTQRFVSAVQPHRARILATRKTTPGLRTLELDAVRHGGGGVHRRSLSDGILIKENHQLFLSASEAVKRARSGRSPLHGIEVEVQSLEMLDAVIDVRPDVVMLDNFSVENAKEAVGRIGGRCRIEISGGIRLDNVAEYAALGVDYISVGRLTHSAPACDLSLDLCRAS